MRKTKRTRAQWHDLVRAWRKSGLTAPDFASSRSIDAGQLRWWAWHLGKEDKTASGSVSFVELPATEEADRSSDIVELVLPDGRVLRFSARIDRVALRSIVRALEVRR